jgi:hypothetical protein
LLLPGLSAFAHFLQRPDVFDVGRAAGGVVRDLDAARVKGARLVAARAWPADPFFDARTDAPLSAPRLVTPEERAAL